MFGWQSRFGTLDAYTGQTGFLGIDLAGLSAGQIIGRNNVSLAVGHAMPRWEQPPSRGSVTRLLLEGGVAGQDSERLEYAWPLKVMAISLYWKVYPLYTPNQNLAAPVWLSLLGNLNESGGYLAVRRVNQDWQVQRGRGATILAPGFTEPANTVFPIELLVTQSSGGTISIFWRDAGGHSGAGGTTPTDANMAITTESWGGGKFFLSGGDGGGKFALEAVKVARGVQTFQSIDTLW